MTLPISTGFALADISAFVLRCPIDTPVRTSFGTMHDRPAVFVRVRDAQGCEGWGETWCNFPACGAEHRARLLDTVLSPMAVGHHWDSPQAMFARLTDATAVLAIQAAEPGPIAQAIAGLDLAVWDLLARRAAQPLWRFLGGQTDTIGVYASGLNPEHPEQRVETLLKQGYRAFKLKIGFGAELDWANLRAIRDLVVRHRADAGDTDIMVDANQNWDLPTAIMRMRDLHRLGIPLGWIEEPLRADVDWPQWRELRQHAPTVLAAGENIAGIKGFEQALAAGALGVIQPDLAKWGGVSGNLPLIDRVHAHGLRLCPHYLGAGVGLLHSAHWLAASLHRRLATVVRGKEPAALAQDWLEVDANNNPLRTLCCGPLNHVRDGRISLGDAPGIGPVPEMAWMRDYLRPHR